MYLGANIKHRSYHVPQECCLRTCGRCLVRHDQQDLALDLGLGPQVEGLNSFNKLPYLKPFCRSKRSSNYNELLGATYDGHFTLLVWGLTFARDVAPVHNSYKEYQQYDGCFRQLT